MCLLLVKTVLFIQLCNGESRYCKEAVDTVKIVESCPASKTEWDNAAFKKDCSKIALQQNCSSVEKFVYHCVINGSRNKTLEVCAPSRLIFGNCVEFNEQGGVIQDQISAPCNETFPKCDDIYLSSTAYKYPDCYQLVSKQDIIHVSTTTATESTQTDGNNISVSTEAVPTPIEISYLYLISIGVSSILMCSYCLTCCILLILYRERRNHIKRKIATVFDNNHQNIETNTTEGRKGMQLPAEKNHEEDAFKAKFDDPGVLQPDSNNSEDVSNAKADDLGVLQPDHKEDCSEAQSDDLGVLQPDSNSLCNSERSTGIISTAPSSSDSSYYDAPEDRILVRIYHVKEDETYL